MSEDTAELIHEIMAELRADLEHGSQSMNEWAASRFGEDYPFLAKKLEQLEKEANA